MEVMQTKWRKGDSKYKQSQIKLQGFRPFEFNWSKF